MDASHRERAGVARESSAAWNEGDHLALPPPLDPLPPPPPPPAPAPGARDACLRERAMSDEGKDGLGLNELNGKIPVNRVRR